MAATNRIPQPDSEFDTYINKTTDYLQVVPDGSTTPHWERLGFTAPENNQWKAFRNNWNDTYDITQTNDTKGVRDSVAIKAKNKAKKDFNDWVQDKEMNKLDRIKGSPNINDTDREVFNIKKPDDTPTARPKITTAPHVDLKGEDGAVILVTCRVDKDSDRSSMHPDADVLEMKYIMVTTDSQPPTSPQALPHAFSSKKAQFRIDPEVENAGLRLYCYLRWANLTEPDKSGPWAQRSTIIIGD